MRTGHSPRRRQRQNRPPGRRPRPIAQLRPAGPAAAGPGRSPPRRDWEGRPVGAGPAKRCSSGQACWRPPEVRPCGRDRWRRQRTAARADRYRRRRASVRHRRSLRACPAPAPSRPPPAPWSRPAAFRRHKPAPASPPAHSRRSPATRRARPAQGQSSGQPRGVTEVRGEARRWLAPPARPRPQGPAEPAPPQPARLRPKRAGWQVWPVWRRRRRPARQGLERPRAPTACRQSATPAARSTGSTRPLGRAARRPRRGRCLLPSRPCLEQSQARAPAQRQPRAGRQAPRVLSVRPTPSPAASQAGPCGSAARERSRRSCPSGRCSRPAG